MSCKKLLAKGIIPLMLLFAAQFSLAQDKTVTGKVTDSKDGSPVAKASVQVKGSGTGTTTADDGTFRLTVGPNVNTLVISSVGFENQEVNITGKSEITINLASLATGLGEVVVVGYGTQKRREVTSAITTVSAEQFNKGNISDVAQLLQGKVAGLSIARPGGNPNAGFQIRLRGISTIGVNTSPLVVVDGQVGADLNTVDPNDIKTIDVLKDGSSAAIYGTRGSAGVIIITTKSGSSGTSQVTYNGAIQIENGARFTKHMTSAEFRDLVKSSGVGTDYGFNTDWNKEITRTGFSHTHNVAFSGGNDKTTYAASFNLRNGEGIAISTGFQQLNGRARLTHRALNNRVVFNLDMTSTRRRADLGFDRAFQYATIYNPTAPIYAQTPDQDPAHGGYFEVSNTEYSNPVAILKQNSNRQYIGRTNITGSVDIEILKGLKFLTRYAQQYSSNYISAYSPSDAFIDRGFYFDVTGLGRHGYAYKRNDLNRSQLYENTLTYAKKVSDIDFTVLGGYSYQDFNNEGTQIGSGNFITDATGQNFATSQDIRNGRSRLESYKNENKLIAFFGRINLNYNNIAFLSASLRREGSTKFGENNKWGYFPAVSAGVDLDKIISVPGFSSLKLRASYGVTGAPPNDSYLSLFTFGRVGSYLIDGNFIDTYGPTLTANPDLKWERKAETDIGVDFVALHNRLTGTMDYYVRKTTDLIFNARVPSPPAPFDRQWKNVGDLKGSGFEIAVNYEVLPKSKTLSWNTGINYSTNKVKLTRLDASVGTFIGETNLGSPGQEATQITRTFAGGEVGTFYQAVYMGVDQNGKFLFDDGTGKAVLSGNTTYKTIIGHGLPRFEMGWTNSFSYKNFDLNFFLRGSFGHDLINTQRAFYENPAVVSAYNIINTKYFNPDLKDAQIFSSYYVEKGDFVKLDNATLGYNFNLPKRGIGTYVKNLRAYLSGYNLFMITGYTGADPEVRYTDGDNPLAPGIDRRATWVLTRSFTFGVNVTF